MVSTGVVRPTAWRLTEAHHEHLHHSRPETIWSGVVMELAGTTANIFGRTTVSERGEWLRAAG